MCDSLSLRRVEVAAKGSRAMLLAGLGVTLAALPFVELVFATLGLAFAVLVVLSAFPVLTFVRAVVGGDP